MADELLDLVDEKDEIIGEVWKSEANQNPELLHREAAVIIYDSSGRVLFQKRSMKKKVNPGIWAETVAGHVSKSENPADTAHRELQEELGFNTELKPFEKTLDHDQKETHFTYWFIGKFPKGAKIKLQKDEVEKVAFLSPKELQKLINSGEVYDPIHFGGKSKDMVKEFWRKLHR